MQIDYHLHIRKHGVRYSHIFQNCPMPLEHMQTVTLLPAAERRQLGQALRKVVPRSMHAAWKPSQFRRNPVDILIDLNRHRIASLLPVRYSRMRQSAFAFYRGAVGIMAADLSDTPTTGLWVQASGDCHLANFGTIASCDAMPVFDINDFDETLPAPFEWDIKRLATSFAVDALSRDLGERAAHCLAGAVAQAYRRHMQELVRLDPLQSWRSRIDIVEVLNQIADPRLRERELKRLGQATAAGHAGYPGLIERKKGLWRIKDRP